MFKKASLLYFVLIIACAHATAQVEVLSTQMAYHKDSATWTMEFRVENGFYVLANDNADANGSTVPIGITWTRIPGKMRTSGITLWPIPDFHGENSVFTEGSYTVKQVFLITNSKEKKSGFIEGKIFFQGCQEDRCYPPNAVTFTTRL